MEFTIKCLPRPDLKPKALRRSGLIPVVLYGHDKKEALTLALDTKTTKSFLQKSQVNNSLVTLEVDELNLSIPTLLREIQTHPTNRHDVYHLSFWAFGNQSVTVTVPITFIGKALGVTNGNGAVDIGLYSLELSCKSGVIPEAIVVDLTPMDVNDTLHVQDLILPEGVVSDGAPDRIVVSILEIQD